MAFDCHKSVDDCGGGSFQNHGPDRYTIYTIYGDIEWFETESLPVLSFTDLYLPSQKLIDKNTRKSPINRRNIK